MSESFDRKRASENDTSIADQFRRNWFASILALCCAVAGATWGVEYQVLVSPRDLIIHNLERELAEKNTPPTSASEKNTSPKVVLQRTWVSEGNSLTVDDGSCFIHVDSVSVDDVDLAITVGAEQPRKFRSVRSGTRLTVSTQTAVYYIDIHEIHEKQVGIEVTRQWIPMPTKK
jgi:hypothetical protein